MIYIGNIYLEMCSVRLQFMFVSVYRFLRMVKLSRVMSTALILGAFRHSKWDVFLYTSFTA